MIIGYLLKVFFGDLSEFESDLFFTFMLPLLIFGAGFNLKRARFFRNIGPIISFVLIGIFAYLWSQQGLLVWNGKTIFISVEEALQIGAILSATDVVCTLALVQEDKTPRLHSILFGESTTNDAIAILLLNLVNNIQVQNLNAVSVFAFIGEFLYNCILSILLGIIFGVLSSYLLKIIDWSSSHSSYQVGFLLYTA